MRRLLLVILMIAVSINQAVAEPGSGKTGIMIYNEAGYYFKGYKNKDLKDEPLASFAVPMASAGSEFRHENSSGYIYGGGISGVSISDGYVMSGVYEYDRQEKEKITVPYLFIGNDFTYWSLEIGVSYYFNIKKPASRKYFEEDGSEKKASSDIFFNRSDSYVFVNMCARILEEDWLHFKIRYGREKFHIIDSLFNIAAVYPKNNHTYELYVSLPAGGELTGYLPKSNQRIGANYLYDLNPVKIGISLGYIIANNRGGGGVGPGGFLDYQHYCIGIIVGLAW